MKANIEGDELLYRAAFSVEKQGYKVTTPKEVRDLGGEYTLTQIKSSLKKQGILEDQCTIEGYKFLVPDEESSLSYAINLLQSWISRVITYADEGANLWLSPSNGSNFRNKVAVTPRLTAGRVMQGYKAGRPRRPIHYQALRDFLISEYLAVEIDGYEADDALGIHKGLMCHIDKDINMVPGEHYHWVNDVRYTVEDGISPVLWEDGKLKAHGKMFFYVQLLLGDSTDNIPGLINLESNKQTNYGPKSVYDLLKNYNKEEEILAKVKELYYNAYKSEWKTRLYEIADLVWIVQTPGVTGSIYLEESGV